MRRAIAAMSFIFVSGFVSTSLAPHAMNFAMSSGRALPVIAARYYTQNAHFFREYI
jgi:hypothetical protein